MTDRARQSLLDAARLMAEAAECFGPRLDQAAEAVADRVRRGGRVYLFGNGGSAADALHWAGELVGRFAYDRPAIPAQALCADPAVLTALANDYGYEAVFARQLAGLAGPLDTAVGISTSGRSENVVQALEAAGQAGCLRVVFCGQDPGPMAARADFLFAVPSTCTPRIQEVHAVLGHVWCELLEARLFPRGEA